MIVLRFEVELARPDGRAVGDVQPGAVWLFDASGKRCYRLAEVRYSATGGVAAPSTQPRHLLHSYLHRLDRRPEYVFRAAPASIEIMGMGTASRTELVAVPCGQQGGPRPSGSVERA